METKDQVQAAEEMAQEVETVGIELLDPKAKQADIIAKLNEVIEKLNEMTPKSNGKTVKDIKSERAMTEEDARRILLGDLKDLTNKEVAQELSLSYGQVYSCRQGFTFKKVYKEYRELASQEQSAE